MLVAILSMEDVADVQPVDTLDALLACVHVDGTVEHHEHLRAIIDVPFIGLIGPVKPDGGVADALDIESVPRSGAGKALRKDCADSDVSPPCDGLMIGMKIARFSSRSDAISLRFEVSGDGTGQD